MYLQSSQGQNFPLQPSLHLPVSYSQAQNSLYNPHPLSTKIILTPEEKLMYEEIKEYVIEISPEKKGVENLSPHIMHLTNRYIFILLKRILVVFMYSL